MDLPPEPALEIEPEVELEMEPETGTEVEASRASGGEKTGRPRIAASSAKEAAKRGTAPSRRPRTARKVTKVTKAAQPANPALSGPLARSLLARRLMARKSAEGDGGRQGDRPLRVR